MTTNEQQTELKRLREILIATIDYLIGIYKKSGQKFEGFNPTDNLQELKKQTEELYKKGKTTKLKNWLRDLTEMPRETSDLNYVIYIKQTTGHDYNIFTSFNKRIDNIIAKGKISTENQYREVNSMVDFLCQTEPVDDKKIEILNNLLLDFQHKLSGKKGKPERFKKIKTKFTSNSQLKIVSPDNKKTFEISDFFTNGVYEQTCSSIMWSDGGGTVLCFTRQGHNISAKWIDSQTLEITHDKVIEFTKKDTKFYYCGDAGAIIYIPI
jgi:hypothetical protein